jgi:ABC-type multidrug transport system fused ATPase/permease subunit
MMAGFKSKSDTSRVLKQSLSLLTKKDKKKLSYIAVVQIFLNALDLIGVLIIGLVTVLAVSALTTGVPGNRLSTVLNLLHIGTLTPQNQAAILGLTAALILVLKTLLSLTLTRRSLIFLNLKTAELSSQLVKKFLNRPLQDIQQKTMYQSLYNLTTGVQAIGNGIIATSLAVVSDFALLMFLFIGLMFVDAAVALISMSLLILTGLVMYKLVQVRAQRIGVRTASLSVQNNNTIIEVFEGYRQAVVRNRRSHYATRIGQERVELAVLNAESAFLPQVNKYVLEIVVIISGLFISGLQFLTNDAYRAVGVLSIFLAASSRMGPAVLRIQQSVLTFKTSVGMAQPTLNLIEELRFVEGIEMHPGLDGISSNHESFLPNITIRNLSINYPGKSSPAISELNMTVNSGTVVAIVGASGAGKSTLVDCLLGILRPSEGSIQISGLDSLEAISRWPGAIGYVPQEVFISGGSVLENVALGFDVSEISKEQVLECLSKVQLLDFIETLPNRVDTNLGDFGSSMSGGQRQRLGIARALYTNPKLLILDEATSAMDGQTESEISKAIQNLKGEITLILVAHRLSTVKSADQVHYIDTGKLIKSGTFEEVRKAVPDFDVQAKLMGL